MMRQLPTLAQGSTQAADVRRAQALLGAAGWGLSLDGSFGPDTASAVRGFQRGHGLSGDGVVGPATWSVLVTGAPA
jgi:peptidoglycan hydrolase-like protein with peptidoglycan-binding domain